MEEHPGRQYNPRLKRYKINGILNIFWVFTITENDQLIHIPTGRKQFLDFIKQIDQK